MAQEKTETTEQLYLDTVHVVLRLTRHLVRYWKALQGQEVTGRQIATLRYLLERGPSTIGDLSSYLFINDSSTSEHVSKLEKSGFVSRKRSIEDNRVVRVSLTKEGAEFASHAPLGGVPLLREKLKGLPQAELRRIRSAVERLIELTGAEGDH